MTSPETGAVGVSRRRDPWPSLQPAWHDPPWLLAGRVATAWFRVPWRSLASVMSPDLLPERADSVRTRLRFYDLSFSVLRRNEAQPLAPTEGRFREAAVGFQACFGTVEGEVSLFLWADSDTYVMWAREAFGWPVLHGRIDLAGTAWTATELAGTEARAQLTDSWGSASLEASVGDRVEGGSPGVPWLTPRRVLNPAGIGGEVRELLAVSPTVRTAGVRYGGTGRVNFAFDHRHPLARFPETETELEVVDGFEIVVGDKVELL